MNKFMKKTVVLCTAGIMGLTMLTACGSELDPDQIVATVGEDTVTLGTANFFARLQQASYETYYAGMMGTTGEEMWNQSDESGVSYQDSVKEGLMDNLTTMYVLRQHADEYGVSVTDEEKESIEKAAKDFIASNDEETLDQLTADETTVKELLELMTIQAKMREPMMEEAEKAAEADKESGSQESDVDAQAAIDYQYNEIIVGWKKDVKVDVDADVWSKVDFKKKGFTMKQQEENK